MISMNLISHICFLVSLLFFVISGVVFFTMDVHRGWHILLGMPMKYSEEQRQKDKIRRKNEEAKKFKGDILTEELTQKIQTQELVQQVPVGEATTVLNTQMTEATTVLGNDMGSEKTTVLGQSIETQETTVLSDEAEGAGNFRIIYEITQCSVSE